MKSGGGGEGGEEGGEVVTEVVDREESVRHGGGREKRLIRERRVTLRRWRVRPSDSTI